ncbi:heterokaryon incompatibility protein-domain-containing protein [Apiospora phragmitis]|uniref:Heterokaryon incompatibility protein-domain-containing protein n=1 Tax=Apiospora phragmitis TaxID=2905665 RepID=A0ABR1VRR8_9PEZI
MSLPQIPVQNLRLNTALGSIAILAASESKIYENGHGDFFTSPPCVRHERHQGNFYNGLQQPAYNALSYTWGRYEVTREASFNGERHVLPVSNITWPIPEIRPDIFTADEFRNAIQSASTDTGWLWVDVACIDQKDVLVRDDEIGRQAAIFNNAARSFVWLHITPGEKLQRLVDILFVAESRADENLVGRSAAAYYGSEYEQPFGSDPGEHQKCIDDPEWVAKVSETLAMLEADPWFSSLWTLQEAYLQQDSTILSKEGRMAQRDGYTAGRDERSPQIPPLDPPRSPLLDEADRIVSRIIRLGLEAGDNPVFLYYAAGYRQTRDEEDRIYGIVHVFGLRLGKAREPGT